MSDKNIIRIEKRDLIEALFIDKQHSQICMFNGSTKIFDVINENNNEIVIGIRTYSNLFRDNNYDIIIKFDMIIVNNTILLKLIDLSHLGNSIGATYSDTDTCIEIEYKSKYMICISKMDICNYILSGSTSAYKPSDIKEEDHKISDLYNDEKFTIVRELYAYSYRYCLSSDKYLIRFSIVYTPSDLISIRIFNVYKKISGTNHITEQEFRYDNDDKNYICIELIEDKGDSKDV